MSKPFNEKRLWSKINILSTNKCWEWQGTKTTAGYGVIRINYELKYAHRTVWEINNKTAIPKKGVICHHCDNPACCNPGHLFLGTQADNLDDAREKGRLRVMKGQGHYNAKLTEDDIRKIRYLGSVDVTRKEIGKRFDVSRMTITDILNKRTWAHIDPEWESPQSKKKGHSHPNAKLTEDDVREIRKLSAGGLSQRKIATQFSVSRGTIEPILKGRTWKHVI